MVDRGVGLHVVDTGYLSSGGKYAARYCRVAVEVEGDCRWRRVVGQAGGLSARRV